MTREEELEKIGKKLDELTLWHVCSMVPFEIPENMRRRTEARDDAWALEVLTKNAEFHRLSQREKDLKKEKENVC